MINLSSTIELERNDDVSEVEISADFHNGEIEYFYCDESLNKKEYETAVQKLYDRYQEE